MIMRKEFKEAIKSFSDALQSKGWGALTPINTITRAFCTVRYGRRNLSQRQKGEVDSALQELKAYRPPKKPKRLQRTLASRSRSFSIPMTRIRTASSSIKTQKLGLSSTLEAPRRFS